MLILGNLYKQQDSLWVVVLSSIEIDGYKYAKKTQVVDDIVMYQYNIEIGDKPKHIQVGHKTITIPNVIPQLNNTSVYFVSCDGQNTKRYNAVGDGPMSNPIKVYNVVGDTDMWKKLYDNIKKDTNIHKYVIHIGDQVYMDEANHILFDNNTTNDEIIIRRTYYDVYKSNYTNRYKKKVLRSAFNVMICDDHDFIDNYGSVPHNLTPTMLSNVFDMYKIFQEDLYGVKKHNIKHLVFKDFQIIIPDLRKYRQLTTDNTTKYPIMGETQMTEFDNIISNTPTNIKRTYYVSTVPLVGATKLLNELYTLFSGNPTVYICDYFQSNGRLYERKHILDTLFEINNVVIIGGDYHYAEYYTLVKNYKEIKQITTSPMSSDPNGLVSPFYIRILAFIFVNLLYERTIDDITICKHFFIPDYNFFKTMDKKLLLCCYDKSNSKSIDM
jgi:hypothetical protein